MLYELIEHRLPPLMEKFAEAASKAAIYTPAIAIANEAMVEAWKGSTWLQYTGIIRKVTHSG